MGLFDGWFTHRIGTRENRAYEPRHYREVASHRAPSGYAGRHVGEPKITPDMVRPDRYKGQHTGKGGAHVYVGGEQHKLGKGDARRLPLQRTAHLRPPFREKRVYDPYRDDMWQSDFDIRKERTHEIPQVGYVYDPGMRPLRRTV